jgi:hypothetical protein
MLATILKSKVASDVTISLIKTFSKFQNIQITIYTSTISKQLKLDYEKYSKQYGNITLKTFKHSHDRFIIETQLIGIVVFYVSFNTSATAF